LTFWKYQLEGVPASGVCVLDPPYYKQGKALYQEFLYESRPYYSGQFFVR